MLAELSIANFAIIERLTLNFAPGFNVLTGETGAGKSIIVDAVALLLGGRASSEYVRAGAERAWVEGAFHLASEAYRLHLAPLLSQHGLEGDEGTILMRREVTREGRSQARVNGHAVPIRVLRQIGERLVDIHGQSEHLSLLRVREHMELLDRFGGLEPLRAQVKVRVAELHRAQEELTSLVGREKELAQREDLLRFQVQEIGAANLRPGEEEVLRRERNLLANAEKLAALADTACRILTEGQEGEKPVSDLLGEVVNALTTLEKLDPNLAEERRSAEAASYQLEDLAQTMRSYRDRIEFNPARLQEVEERLSLIHHLKRKYGDTIEEIVDYGRQAARELEETSHSEERVEELRAKATRLKREIGDLAGELSLARHEAAARLEEAVEGELEELNLGRARFVVSLEREESKDGVEVDGLTYSFSAAGIDQVEFLISPNVGEPPRGLGRIASGGEMSRLMLALKSILSAADQTPTLIFDEIDAGIGSRAGAVVGRKLGRLAREHQVICATHLSQLAAFADSHFRVLKVEEAGRTTTQAELLDEAERIEELTLMLGGAGEAAQRTAKELYQRARRVA